MLSYICATKTRRHPEGEAGLGMRGGEGMGWRVDGWEGQGYRWG